MSKSVILGILSLVLLFSAPSMLATAASGDDAQTDCEEVVQNADAEATKLTAAIIPSG